VRVVLDWKLSTLGDPLAAVVTATAGSSIMAS
jgi:aminoglycoside phosphotransferase (APT) family kinase protein